MIALAIGALVARGSSWLLTGCMRQYAISRQLLDLPNARSSHSSPTPRGGGVAIVLSFSGLTAVLASKGLLPLPLLLALLGSSLLVAITGFLDDHHPLPARWRLLIHAAAAIWALWCMGGIPPVPMLGMSVDLGAFGLALAAAYLVWMVNLYNFMDGIDGIASIEAITVSLGGALCWWLACKTPLWFLPVVFAACVAGFLIWNYPPAKIFMGDAGSGFIGIVLGVLSLWSGQQAPQVFWCWFILGGCFMVDATTTLIRRVHRRESFYEAHRSHAYQYASRRHASHRNVSLAVALINVLWLLPLALLVAVGMLDGLLAAVIGYVPLGFSAFRYKAGDRVAQEA